MVLLPRLRDDIAEYKKLNFHLFQALHKAMYKPQAFFKGILLPLCEVIFFSILGSFFYLVIEYHQIILKLVKGKGVAFLS